MKYIWFSFIATGVMAMVAAAYYSWVIDPWQPADYEVAALRQLQASIRSDRQVCRVVISVGGISVLVGVAGWALALRRKRAA
jgi:hypothetical protein